MEPISLEQLALTCKTLRGSRILELYRELAEYETVCEITNGVLYATSKLFKCKTTLWYQMNDVVREIVRELIQAMERREVFVAPNEWGDNYLSTDGEFFTVSDGYDADVSGLYEISVTNDCVIDELRKILD